MLKQTNKNTCSFYDLYRYQARDNGDQTQAHSCCTFHSELLSVVGKHGMYRNIWIWQVLFRYWSEIEALSQIAK